MYKKKILVLFILIFVMFMFAGVLSSCEKSEEAIKSEISRLLEKASEAEAKAELYLREGNLDLALMYQNKADGYRSKADAMRIEQESPSNLKIEGDKITWKNNEDREYNIYDIYVNVSNDQTFGDPYSKPECVTREENVPLSEIFDYNKSYKYYCVRVVLRGDKYYKDSDYSEKLIISPEYCKVKYYYDVNSLEYEEKEYIKGSNPSYKSEYTNELGKYFVGWYYDREFSKPLNESEKLYSDISLYAKWSDYKITDNKLKSVCNGIEYIDFNCDELKYIDTISEYAFRNCNNLKGIIFSNKIDSIPSDLLKNLKSLEYIYIPCTIDELTKRMFDYVDKQKLVVYTEHKYKLPDWEVDYVDIVYDCKNEFITSQLGFACITNNDNTLSIIDYKGSSNSLLVPNEINGKKVNRIAKKAFANCTTLSYVNISEGIESVEDEAFINCSNLMSIKFPNSLKYNGYSVLNNANRLQDITIPFVGNGKDNMHFGYIFGKENSYDYYIPTSLRKITITSGKMIGEEAFRSCEYVVEINLADTLIEIGKGAFGNCNSLKNLVIPEGVKYIREKAFWGCDKLTSINLPSSLLLIESRVFLYCRSLNIISYNGTKKMFNDISKGNFWDMGLNCDTIQCSDGNLII